MIPSTKRTRLIGQRTQSGIALVVALIFLVILTVIGVSAMQTATLQERMAGNARDRNIAFQAAETALRDGEQWIIDSGAWEDLELHKQKDFLHLRDDEPDWRDIECSEDNVREVSVEGVAQDPCYVIAEFEPMRPRGGMARDVVMTAFRITAIGTGRTTNTRVVLTSTAKFEN